MVERTKAIKKWVYGTRTRKWYLIGESDRDFQSGITQKEFKQLGTKKATKKYLNSHMILTNRKRK